MYVGLKMITDVIAATKDTLVSEANELMEQHQLWSLPVEKSDKLIGYILMEDVRAALPSPATLLSKHELPEVMEHLRIEDFIRIDPITVTPETEIETAAELMFEHKIPGMAVVNAKGKLVGYINRTVMLEVLVEELGLHRGGKRFAIEFKDRPGVMAEVSKLIADMNINFVSAASFFHDDICILVFRIETDDLAPVTDELKKRGYEILGPEVFAHKWE